MGKFWTRFILDNGQRMSRKQVKKVDKLEKEILECLVLIDHLEDIIERHSEEIECIKKGGEQRADCVSDNDF
jgi:hypothetical protein